MFVQGTAAGAAFVACWMAWQTGTSPGPRRFWLPVAVTFGIAGWRWALSTPDASLWDSSLLITESVLWIVAVAIYRKDNNHA